MASGVSFCRTPHSRIGFIRLSSCLPFFLGLACSMLAHGVLPAQQVHWIWSSEQDITNVPLGSCYFRKAFRMIDPDRGQLQISANDQLEVYLNGRRLGADFWQRQDVAVQHLQGNDPGRQRLGG